ncbi:hypothetical protein [Streptomyces sp. NPDC088733]|uniref:hypothetical protein n=1 Tax=Streptomyces sp. NPDC088733 TaxID=3365880 RepID=UPI0037F19353
MAKLEERDGTRIVGALEAAWSTIRTRHPEVPDVVVVTGSGKPTRGKYLKLGSHDPERWVDAAVARRRPQVFISGELLAMGGHQVLQTMLHEAAHALAFARGRIKDTSASGNRWHNRRFAKLAEELGLQPPQRAEPVLGFSNCVLSDDTARSYATVIRRLDQAQLPFMDGKGASPREGEDETGAKPKKENPTAGKRVAAECGCEPPRRLQITPKLLQEGPVLCGLCEDPFAHPDVPAVADDVPGQEDAA